MMKMSTLSRFFCLSTPFFVYDFSAIRRQFKKLNKILPAKTEIFYSVKTNPSLAILAFLRRLDIGTEITSAGELFAVQKCGYTPENIIFTGSGKSDEELILAVKSDIRFIIIESLNEAKKIDSVAEKFKKRQNILMRLNLARTETDSTYKMSGGCQKLGVDEETAEKVMRQLFKLQNINLLGFHFYGASGVFDYRIILRNFENFFKAAARIEKIFGIKFLVLDIGGGMMSSIRDKKFDISRFGRGLKTLLKRYTFDNKNLIFEIGRFLIAESGYYITKIIDIKESRGRKIIIVDGGMNHLSRAGIAGEGHEVSIAPEKKDGKKFFEKVDIAGPLATPTDILTRNVLLPRVGIGDLLIFRKAGAYGLTAGMLYFSSRSLPAEYALISGRLIKIRRERKVNKIIFSDQIIPKNL